MDIRGAARTRIGARVASTLQRLNSRHPWSHNDAFHPWIETQLPRRRHSAVDVGCGRGELLALLSSHFDRVHGIDPDAEMRQASAARCAGLPHVTVDATSLAELSDGVDLVTMIAVLHHLDLEGALAQVRRVLAPGGRFLCVGLARPESPADQAWDAASMVTNPIIGFVRHPWVSEKTPDREPFPVKDPQLSFAQIRARVDRAMPGAVMQRQLGFRHTIAWTKPAPG